MFEDSEFEKLTKDDIGDLLMYYPIRQLVAWYNYKSLDQPLNTYFPKKIKEKLQKTSDCLYNSKQAAKVLQKSKIEARPWRSGISSWNSRKL